MTCLDTSTSHVKHNGSLKQMISPIGQMCRKRQTRETSAVSDFERLSDPANKMRSHSQLLPYARLLLYYASRFNPMPDFVGFTKFLANIVVRRPVSGDFQCGWSRAAGLKAEPQEVPMSLKQHLSFKDSPSGFQHNPLKMGSPLNAKGANRSLRYTSMWELRPMTRLLSSMLARSTAVPLPAIHRTHFKPYSHTCSTLLEFDPPHGITTLRNVVPKCAR